MQIGPTGKTTLDIPEGLYRRVKAKGALLGKHVREVTIELYRRWLAEHRPAATEQWLEDWIRLGQEALGNVSGGPTASGILARDRRNLERG
ncbi:MAG: hypothetical protein C4303_04935 [candidate division GAL15 bacterium]